MKEKLLTFWWFIQRPKMYGQIWQLFLRRFFLRNDRYKEFESIKWCESISTTEKDGFHQLFPDVDFENLNNRFPEIINSAIERVKSSPFEMGGAGALDLIYNITSITKVQAILETGVSYGWSSLAFLLALKDQSGRLFSIDMPYPKMGNEDFVGIAVPSELKKNWTLYNFPDRVGIPRAINNNKAKFDLIHYDSDKSYSGRKWAYPILWEALKTGGLFISDDIQDNIAFKEFCDQLNLKPTIVESQNKFVGILRKCQ